MHELAAAEKIAGLVAEECRKSGLRNPKRIILELGELTTYSAEPLCFYFDVLRKDEPLLGDAGLEIIPVPARVACRECMKESRLKDISRMCCPECGSDNIRICGGREFLLKGIEW